MVDRQVYHCTDCNICIACGGKEENPHTYRSIRGNMLSIKPAYTVGQKYIMEHDMNDTWKLKLKSYDNTIYGVENASKGLYELDNTNRTYVLKKDFHMLNEHNFPTILPYDYFNYKR